MKKRINRILIFMTILFMSCSVFNQNDFVKNEKIGLEIHKNISLGYKLYQTGFDNFRYEFYLVQVTDTVDLFETYLNDATYKNVTFKIEEKYDSILIYSNYNLGEIEKKIDNINFKLDRIKVK
jgi:hypothetical protein